jgi:hypothetical protein
MAVLVLCSYWQFNDHSDYSDGEYGWWSRCAAVSLVGVVAVLFLFNGSLQTALHMIVVVAFHFAYAYCHLRDIQYCLWKSYTEDAINMLQGISERVNHEMDEATDYKAFRDEFQDDTSTTTTQYDTFSIEHTGDFFPYLYFYMPSNCRIGCPDPGSWEYFTYDYGVWLQSRQDGNGLLILLSNPMMLAVPFVLVGDVWSIFTGNYPVLIALFVWHLFMMLAERQYNDMNFEASRKLDKLNHKVKLLRNMKKVMSKFSVIGVDTKNNIEVKQLGLEVANSTQ